MNNIKDSVESIYKWIRNIRRELHMYPEAGMQEFKTSVIICRVLDELKIPYKKGIAKTGIVGFIESSNSDKTVALRADMDGLPIFEENNVEYKSKNIGFMHACGHDAHVAIQLGTAKILNENKDKLPCNVKLIFQPAEEFPGGAVPMIEEGVLEEPKVDCIFGLHTDSTQEKGIVTVKYGVSQAAVDTLKINIYGKSAHAAHPVSGVDAILIAGHVITAIQSIVSRNTGATDSLVISIGKISGGTKENIIAGEVEMEGTMRSLSKEVRDNAVQRLIDLVQSISSAFGGVGKVDIIQDYCPLENDDRVLKYIHQNAESLVGYENVVVYDSPSMGGEDYAFFLKKVPGAFFKFGTKNEERMINAPAHNCCYDIDEDSLKTGIAMQVMNVMNFDKLKL